VPDFVRIVVVAVVGLALGLVASGYALSRMSPFDRTRLGAWSIEPHAGSVDADPYTRARMARSGEIPLAIGEGLELIAREDDEGRPLEARCVYKIGPRAPAARYWTLSLVDLEGFPVANPPSATVSGRPRFCAPAERSSSPRRPTPSRETGCRSARRGGSRWR